MKHALHKLILGFLLLWLPLQGFAAAGMSFCRHDHAPAAAMQSVEYHSHECCPQTGHDAAADQTLCDDCGYCHLGAAPALLPAAVTLSENAGSSLKFSFVTTFPLFYPEQPQRPPHPLFS